MSGAYFMVDGITVVVCVHEGELTLQDRKPNSDWDTKFNVFCFLFFNPLLKISWGSRRTTTIPSKGRVPSMTKLFPNRFHPLIFGLPTVNIATLRIKLLTHEPLKDTLKPHAIHSIQHMHSSILNIWSHSISDRVLQSPPKVLVLKGRDFESD